LKGIFDLFNSTTLQALLFSCCFFFHVSIIPQINALNDGGLAAFGHHNVNHFQTEKDV